MNKLMIIFSVLILGAAAQADTGAVQLIRALATELPPNPVPYAGKNNGRPCWVKVDAIPQDQLYVVTVIQETRAGDRQQMSFAINPKSRVSDTSYVGRKSEFIETSVDVETGRMIKFEELYGNFAESTMGLEIRKSHESRSLSARKIWVTNLKAGKIAASGPACIIDLR